MISLPAFLRKRLEGSPLAYRLARGAFWSVLGGVSARALALLSAIIVARLLGREGYGEIGIVQSTLGMFGVFAGFGLGSTSTKYIAEYREKDPGKAGRIASLVFLVSLVSAGTMMALTAALAPWLSQSILSRPDLSTLLLPGSLLLFVSTLVGVQSATLAGFESFRQIAFINIARGLAAPFVTIPLVWFYGEQGAIASFTINASFALILFSRSLMKEFSVNGIPLGLKGSILSESRILWDFSLPAMLSGLFYAPAIWVTHSILAHHPDGYGELGLFYAANRWRMVVIFLPGMLAQVMLPAVSDLHGRKDKKDFVKAISLYLNLSWIAALPLTVLVILFATPLAALFGKQFHGADSIMAFLMAAYFLNVLSSAVGTAIAGSGRMWAGMLMNLTWAAALIASAALFVPAYGGRGLGMACFTSYLLHFVVSVVYTERHVARSLFLDRWKLILFSSFIFALCLQPRLLLFPSSTFVKAAVFILSSVPLLRFLLLETAGRPALSGER